MFDSVGTIIERGEAFTQSLSPASLCVGDSSAPVACKIGHLKYHEFLGAGGIRSVKSMRVSLRRMDVNPAIQFTRGQHVTVKRQLRGVKGEEALALQVGDDNGSDAVTICLTLERHPV